MPQFGLDILYDIQYAHHRKEILMATKTSRIDLRITDVIRGKLAEDAGPHGSLSSVARSIIEQHYAMMKGRKKIARTVRASTTR
jgi:hypothetical protein